MTIKTLLISCTITAVVTAAAVRYYYPRVDVQTIETTKDVIKTDIRTVVRVVEKPDGTKETVTETVDNTTRETKDKKSHIENKQNDWFIAAGVNARLNAINVPSYAISVHRRVLGPVFGGLTADTTGNIGVTIGLEF